MVFVAVGVEVVCSAMVAVVVWLLHLVLVFCNLFYCSSSVVFSINFVVIFVINAQGIENMAMVS